jgi:glycosyltransferase involved in cell wall biosynthesis
MLDKVIGIDIREAHGTGAGKGRYTEEITRALIEFAPPNVHFVLFNKHHNPRFPNSSRVKQISVPGKSFFWHLNLVNYLKKKPVHAYLAPTSFLVPALAPKSLKSYLVVHDMIAWHSSKDHPWFPTLVERLSLKRAIQKAQAIFMVSNQTKKDLLEIYPEANQKPICTVTPAVGKEFYPERKFQMELPDQFILSVGSNLPRKNHQRIFQAFKKLALKHPNLHLVIAGGGHEKSDHERIHCLGYVQEAELRELYSRAQCLLFPSLYEGFGIPALEAMACACPVITSKNSSLPEATGEAALLIDPEQVDKMVTAVDTMLDRATRATYVQKGLDHVKTFSWEKSAKEMLKLL